MSANYPYTQNNLLDNEPFHYHYTAYQGPAFIEAYFRDRRRALEQLNSLIGGAPSADAPGIRVLAADSDPPLSYPFMRPVETAPELAGAVSWVARGGDPDHRDLVALVNELARKFEISKRLRSRYGTGLRVVVHDSAPLDAYCHLAFLVAQRTDLSKSLWHLNALLKLNDLLISTSYRSLTPAAASAAERAIQIEVEEVAKLDRKKRIAGNGHAGS